MSTIKIYINPNRENGKINPMIFGNFIENLDDCIYGGVYDRKSPKSDENGFRIDVIEGAKAMGITNVRYPGGCYAPYYHFYNGIGENRPLIKYGDYNPSHEFGTDEFVKWCSMIGAEPFICVNMGTGTPEEAMNWVKYCNGSSGDLWADKRIANGHEKPYNVKYWAIGNEISAPWELGYTPTPADYIRRAREFAMAMKAADPTIKLIFSGAHFPIDFPHDNWNREILDALYEYIDYINIHHYIGHDYKDEIWNKWKNMTPQEIHYHLSDYMQLLEDAVRMLREDIRFIGHKKNSFKHIGIAIDEYNPWYRQEERHFVPMNLSDSLLVASYFNIFFRNSDIIDICNMAQLVNTIPAMVAEAGGSGFFRQGISYVQEMMRDNCDNTAIDIWCDSPVFKGSYYPSAPILDMSASKSANKIYVNIANRDTENTYNLSFCIPNAEIKTVNAKRLYNKDIEAVNSFDNPHRLSIELLENIKKIEIEPLSVYVFEIIIK